MRTRNRSQFRHAPTNLRVMRIVRTTDDRMRVGGRMARMVRGESKPQTTARTVSLLKVRTPLPASRMIRHVKPRAVSRRSGRVSRIQSRSSSPMTVSRPKRRMRAKKGKAVQGRGRVLPLGSLAMAKPQMARKAAHRRVGSLETVSREQAIQQRTVRPLVIPAVLSPETGRAGHPGLVSRTAGRGRRRIRLEDTQKSR
jgi:hypothetical protein